MMSGEAPDRPGGDAPFDAELGELVEALLAGAPVSGGVLAVSAAGRSYELPFGTRGPGGPAIGAAERFEIGSISKTMTALAAARLEAEGVWDLEQPVRSALPWLRLPQGAGEPSLRHLLSHTAGWIAGNSASPGEIAQALGLPGTRAVAAPGEFFHYSNVGYVVLGLAMAAVAGRPFPELMRELVLEPLGLPGALASITGAERASLCPGTVPLRDDAPWLPGDPVAAQTWLEPAGADGNVGASVGELLAFARALADPDAAVRADPAGRSWLPDAVRRIAAPAAPAGETILQLGRHLPVAEARYGLGVNVERTALGTLLTHGGGMVGYGAFMIAHPERGIAVAAVLSAPGERPYAELLARSAHAALMPRSARPDEASVRPGVADPVAAVMPLRPPLRQTPRLPSGVGVGADSTVDIGVEEGVYAGLTGHYRSYTPWCPHYEVGIGPDEHGVERLMLRAYAGVEAETEDTPLVPIPGAEGRRFRIGDDPRLPERLEFRDAIDGRAQTLDIDGCLYARVVDR